MALTTPTITGCTLAMSISPAVVNLITDSIPIDLSIFFNGITSLQTVSGTYTPNNDTLSLVTGLVSNFPNFVILVTDGQANLTMKSGGVTVMSQNPMIKLFFNPMIANSTYGITDIILDGTTSALVPMVQTVPVSYTLFYGVGIVN